MKKETLRVSIILLIASIIFSPFLASSMYNIELDSLGRIILAMVLGDITIMVGVVIAFSIHLLIDKLK